ncbi:MAG: hypothetical protein ABIB79_04615 [archaeon]
MVRKFQINFNFSNRAIYTLVAIGVLIVAGWFVWAYQSGYNDPSIMGHSSEELDLSSIHSMVAIASGQNEPAPNPDSYGRLYTTSETTGASYPFNEPAHFVIQGAPYADSIQDIVFLTGSNGGNMPLVLKGNGKVGIGTTNPGDELEVVGTIQAENFKIGSYSLTFINPVMGLNSGCGKVCSDPVHGGIAGGVCLFCVQYNTNGNPNVLGQGTVDPCNTDYGGVLLSNNKMGYAICARQ